MIKNTSQCNKSHQFVFPVEEEVRFITERELLLFFVEMGNCQSRLCCMADNSEDTSLKKAKSEMSANSRSPNFERFLSYVCDAEQNHPSNAASKQAEEYTETATKPKKVDEETRKDFLRQLYRTAWKDVNQRIIKAREVALARRENGVNQGASTSSAESPSCNVPSSDDWLVCYPCLFDSIGCSEDDDGDKENRSHSSAARQVANVIKFKLFFRDEEPEERDRLQRSPQKSGPIDGDFSKPH